jgi:hypothetical protein
LIDLLSHLFCFFKVKAPNYLEELNLKPFGVHYNEVYSWLNPMIIVKSLDLLLLLIVDETIGPHVYEFLEIVLREDFYKVFFNSYFLGLFIENFLRNKPMVVDPDDGVKQKKGDRWLKSVEYFLGLVLKGIVEI